MTDQKESKKMSITMNLRFIKMDKKNEDNFTAIFGVSQYRKEEKEFCNQLKLLEHRIHYNPIINSYNFREFCNNHNPIKCRDDIGFSYVIKFQDRGFEKIRLIENNVYTITFNIKINEKEISNMVKCYVEKIELYNVFDYIRETEGEPMNVSFAKLKWWQWF
jgi:hypothetical protein